MNVEKVITGIYKMKLINIYLQQRGLKVLDSLNKVIKIDTNDKMSEEEIQRRFEALNLTNDPNELSEEEIAAESKKTTDSGEELESTESEENNGMELESSETVEGFLAQFGKDYGILSKAMVGK